MNSQNIFTAFVTLVLLIGAYLGYEQSVGRLTDLQQLSSSELPPKGPVKKAREPVVDKGVRRESEIAAVRGFGPNCEELNAPLILESRKRTGSDSEGGRGLGLYIYALDYEILKDNPKQMRLHPFSLVHITRSENGGTEKDEINTLRGKQAILEFDRPIELTKISGAKPISGWVQGDVELKSNRRTADPTDDIVLFTDKLHYDEGKNLIWADDWIRVVEREATINGVGMELELNEKADLNKPVAKPKSEAKCVRLFKSVRFDLLVDNDANFLGSSQTNREEPALERTLTPLTVTARGPFEYDLERNQAQFHESVRVLKTNPPKDGKEETIDQLECDDLVLQFRKDEKPAEGAAPPPPADQADNGGLAANGKRSMRLHTATATGKMVILLSDSQRLQATGNYLFHDADAKRGILRGKTEMIAIHENTEIHARSLIIDQNQTGNGGSGAHGIRQLVADGPDGWLEVADDKEPGKPQLRIRWQGKLDMTANPETEGQLVNITDNVELDDQRGAMKCDRLKVWLVPDPSEEKPAIGPNGKRAQRKLQPVKIEATGNVASRSSDLSVVTEVLLMDIQHKKEIVAALPEDAAPVVVAPALAPAPVVAPALIPSPNAPPGARGQTKAAAPVANSNPAPTAKQPVVAANPPAKSEPVLKNAASLSPTREPAPLAKEPAPIVNARPREETAEATEEKQEPLDVKAKRVAVVIEKRGGKSKPIRAWAEGDVLVTQPPKEQGDVPLKITGETLQFERKTEGDVLRVGGGNAGKVRRTANVVTNEMTLVGENEVYMNEVDNKVEVAGAGYLIMESGNDLTGKKMTKPSLVRIDWRKGMLFDGKLANFVGGVKAQQGPAEIHCRNMDVSFERRIIFRDARQKRGKSKQEREQIETVDCDSDVLVYDQERDERGNAIRHTTMRCVELHFDNLDRTAVASGPGVVQIIEKNMPSEDEEGRMQPPKSVYNLTQISYFGQMRVNNKNQTAKFFENIRILRTPVDRLDEGIDEDNLPKDGVTVDAVDRAEMCLRESGGQKFRDFQAFGNVRVHAREHWGQSDELSYDQQKDMLVFHSKGNRKAQFYRQERVGQKPQEFSARTIKYIRSQDKITSIGADGFHHIDFGPKQQQAAPVNEPPARPVPPAAPARIGIQSAGLKKLPPAGDRPRNPNGNQ